jgi:hypothetical protein
MRAFRLETVATGTSRSSPGTGSRKIRSRYSFSAGPPTWCVAKLERYLHDLSGFLSIVPRRAAEDGSINYSPYIGYELSLARRSGLPRLTFVDDEVLNRYRARFLPDVIPFVRSSPAADRFRHVDAIREFRKALEGRGTNQKRKYRDRSVTVVTAGGPALSQATDVLMDVLRSKAYDPVKLRQRSFRKRSMMSDCWNLF